jgi:hypothetical protein
MEILSELIIILHWKKGVEVLVDVIVSSKKYAKKREILLFTLDDIVKKTLLVCMSNKFES